MTALNIKNEEVVKLIKELAELHGESMTAVVTVAVREKLERDRKPEINEQRMQYWLDFGRRARESTDPKWLAVDTDELLYDEKGLPK